MSAVALVVPQALAQQSRAQDVPNKEALREVPSAQKLEDSQAKIGQMRRTLQSSEVLLERARNQERDIRKLNCINEKLVSMKGFVKVSEQSYVQLKDAVSRQDDEGSAHAYSLVVLSDDKVTRLGDEARLCVGEVAEVDPGGQAGYTADPDIAPVQPVELDGHLNEWEGWYAVLDPERVPELTPFQ